MSDRIHVATRKGLLTLERKARGGWEVSRVLFLGDPVTMVLDDPRDGALYAALNLGHFGVKLRRSPDGGKSWKEVATPSFPPEPESKLDATPKGASMHQLWALVTGRDDRPGELWAGAIPAGLFHSLDGGESWELNRPLWDRPERKHWFGGGYDDAGIHSICVDPRDQAHLAVAVSCGGVWFTEDGGKCWEVRTKGMFAEYMPEDRREDPDIQDPHLLAQCPSSPDHLWVQHHNGVFRSENRGRSWSHVDAIRPSKFGFAVAVHPNDPQTAWFVPGVKDECRVPVDGKLVVARTRDGGASFDVLREGLPQTHAYDLVYRHALDVSACGERLAIGSTTGGLWISENGGDSWQTVSVNLPPIYQLCFAA